MLFKFALHSFAMLTGNCFAQKRRNLKREKEKKRKSEKMQFQIWILLSHIKNLQKLVGNNEKNVV